MAGARKGEEFWRERITGWKRSKLSQAAYCQANELSYDSFVYWRCRFRKKDRANKEGKLVSLTLENQSSTSLHEDSTPPQIETPQLGVDVELPNGVRLSIKHSQSIELATMLIKSLFKQ